MGNLIQNQDMVYVIYAGIALGVFLLFTGVTQALSRSENSDEAKNRRMRMINKGATTAEILALLKPPLQGGPLSQLPFIGDLPKAMRRAGMTMAPPTLAFLCLLAAVATFAGAFGFVDAFKALAAALVVGFILPVVVIRTLSNKRSEALTSQLPDALDLLARGLKVGHPLNTTINSVAREMEDPIATEFGLIFDQVSYGDDLVDAFSEFAERVEIEDVRYLAASIGIQHGTGGDLARVIQVLSKVIRDRIAMRRKIRAITSEGRLSAYFMSAIPLVIYGFTSLTNPTYYGSVADDPLFVPMMSAVVVFTVLNALILKKLVNFRI
jgi:tight adherence protein B